MKFICFVKLSKIFRTSPHTIINFVPKFARMSEKKSTKKLKIQVLLKEVQSENMEKAKAALQSLKTHGDVSVIEPLLLFQASPEGKEMKFDIHVFLADIHDVKAVPEFMRLLDEPTSTEYRVDLLNVLWNSKLDYSEHISKFVEMAVEGDFLIALECLTIIENLAGPFEEEAIIESQLSLGQYATHPTKSEQKDQLISDIAVVIQAIERSIDG